MGGGAGGATRGAGGEGACAPRPASAPLGARHPRTHARRAAAPHSHQLPGRGGGRERRARDRSTARDGEGAGQVMASTSFIDPHALMRIKSLQLRARLVVQGFLSGLHRSPHHGFSVEFSEYRQYSPGDDPRYVDWRVFARSDRYYIKRFEEETNLRCHLLVDLSKSMGFSSVKYTKADYAR